MERIAPPLTPNIVRQIIQEEERSRRQLAWAPETAEKILRYGAVVGCVIEHHLQLSRGMDRARLLIKEAETGDRSLASGTVILADELTDGKGRFQRPWHAPPGGIWLTLVLANTLLPASSRLYPLAAGVACCETIRAYGIPAANLKWVNDVLVKGCKIAGILTETFTSPRFNEEYVLIGIGLNANNEKFPPELSQTATALKSQLHNDVDLPLLAGRLLAKLSWNIGLLHYEEERLLQAGGTWQEDFQPEAGHKLLERWLALSDITGRRVLYGYDVQQDPQFEARVRGLDKEGGMVLELTDGTTMVEYSGEIVYLD